jgi:hypothetical protein
MDDSNTYLHGDNTRIKASSNLLQCFFARHPNLFPAKILHNRVHPNVHDISIEELGKLSTGSSISHTAKTISGPWLDSKFHKDSKPSFQHI